MGIAEIHIDKHRNGPTGKVNLFFDERKVSFKNLDAGHYTEEPIQEEESMPLPQEGKKETTWKQKP